MRGVTQSAAETGSAATDATGAADALARHASAFRDKVTTYVENMRAA
jgi:hypothetical protein